MRPDQISENAICPFYQQTVRTKHGQFVGIECEPLMTPERLGFRASHILRLASGDLLKYAEIFCESQDWKTCPYAAALLKLKYKET